MQGELFEKPYKYVIDTSILIDFKERFHRGVFKTLWNYLEQASKDEVVIFVKATKEELFRHGALDLSEWVSNFYLHLPTLEEQLMLGQLQEDYPDLIDWNATKELADPYIIACAYNLNLTIVSQEKWNHVKAKIPTVAKAFGVRCIGLNSFFLEMGWEF